MQSAGLCCFRYHKGTDFQANHNLFKFVIALPSVVLDTTKVQIFKQITTAPNSLTPLLGCFRYHKGTDFQANHNEEFILDYPENVVLDTTKVQIFKQITTRTLLLCLCCRCFRYHKGTDFQANHNVEMKQKKRWRVVLDTTKVQIFKQITTGERNYIDGNLLF